MALFSVGEKDPEVTTPIWFPSLNLKTAIEMLRKRNLLIQNDLKNCRLLSSDGVHLPQLEYSVKILGIKK